MNTTHMSNASADELRKRMVDRLVMSRAIRSPRVEEAMRAVRRHEHLPAASVEKAYADEAVNIKTIGTGGPIVSCASMPTVVAMMLDQLDVRSGDNILEIGAGTGYNAALLAYLTGNEGLVTTVDVDTDVTEHARRALRATGYDQVRVVDRDGALGSPEGAPFDRIIVTVGAWDLPSAWLDQLAEHGRLVVPLRWRGQTRSVAFVREEDRLVSDSVELCGFIPMVGQEGELEGSIDAEGLVKLTWDVDQDVSPTVLRGVLDQPKTHVWSGVTVGPVDPFDGVWLRLTATEPGTCRISAQPGAIEAGSCTPAIPALSPALASDASLAYLAKHRLSDDEPRWELGAVGQGPDGAALADRICQQIRAWDSDQNARLVITALPAGALLDPQEGGYVIDKPSARLMISF